jgi:DNA-directed RNA polymerase subunit H (RpoH/RPB5)
MRNNKHDADTVSSFDGMNEIELHTWIIPYTKLQPQPCTARHSTVSSTTKKERMSSSFDAETLPITRLEDLRKMRSMVQDLMLARNLLPPEECGWSLAALHEAFREKSHGATRLVAHDTVTGVDPRLVVFFATPRIGDKLNRDAIECIFQEFETFISDFVDATPDIIVISNDEVSAHVLRSLAQWRQDWGAGRPPFLLQTMKESMLRFNPIRRLDGPLFYRSVSEKEEEAVLRRARADKGELPRFSPTDPVVAFMGFWPGQLIEMKKKSETAGLIETLRVVGRPDVPVI